MRTASNDSALSPWLWGIIHHKPTEPGGFLKNLARTAMNADVQNYEILRPALLVFQEKYPDYFWVPADGWMAEG